MTEYEPVSIHHAWDITLHQDPKKHEYELLAEGDEGEFLIKSKNSTAGELELVIKTSSLKMPELNPENQLQRLSIVMSTEAGHEYKIQSAAEGFPTLESLVKYYARKARPLVGMALELSGPFFQQRRQRSRLSMHSSRTIGSGSANTQTLRRMRSHLPIANDDDDNDHVGGGGATYEADTDVLTRANNSVHGGGAKSISVDAHALSQELSSLAVTTAPPPPAPPQPPGGAAPPPGPPPPPVLRGGPAMGGGGGLLGALGGIGQVQLKKRGKSADELEAEKKAQVLSKRMVPDAFGLDQWLNTGSDGGGAVAYAESGRISRLLQHDTGAKCVVVDFFAYSCTNCLRTIPVLRHWHERYHEYGLRIIGFHRPEFEFEKDIRNLANFARAYDIEYPIGLDNDSAAWVAWGVESWPTHFLVPRPMKKDGPLVKGGDPHIGDRHHDNLERSILDALIARQPDAARSEQLMTWRREVSPINRDVFFDLEFFLGSTHIEKNGATNGTTPPSGTDACDDGVCKFVPSKARKSSKRRASEDLGFGSAPTSLLFDRNGHTGTIALGDGSTGSGKHCNAAWAQTSEYCVAETGRRWTLTATCAVGATPDVAAPSDVSMFLVAEPLPGMAASVTVQVVTGSGGGGGGGTDTEVVDVGVADRHYLGRYLNGCTLALSGADPVRIYSLYITTEPFDTALGYGSTASDTPVDHPTTPTTPDAPTPPLVTSPPRPKLEKSKRGGWFKSKRGQGLERRPTGTRVKPRRTHPTEKDMQFLMPENSGRSSSYRIFDVYADMYPDRTRAGVFTVRESSKSHGAYTIDVCGEGSKVVHMLVDTGPNGPQVHANNVTYPSLSAFVAHFRAHPLDLPGMDKKGMAHVKLGACVSQGLSVGGGARSFEGDGSSEGEVTQPPPAMEDIRRIYHTVVVRRLPSGALPFVLVKADQLDYAMVEIKPEGRGQKLSVRNGDVVLGINGQAVNAKQAIKCMRKAPKAFTMDVERIFIG